MIPVSTARLSCLVSLDLRGFQPAHVTTPFWSLGTGPSTPAVAAGLRALMPIYEKAHRVQGALLHPP